MLAKQGWYLLSHPTLLLCKVLKAKYFPSTSLLEATAGIHPSLTWRSTVSARHLLNIGYQMREVWGKAGEFVPVWQHCHNGIFLVRSAYRLAVERAVSGEALASYLVLYILEGQDKFWYKLWCTKVSPKVRVLIWKLCYEAFLMMENLAKRRVGVDVQCPVFFGEFESFKHIMLECPYARQTWALSHLPWNVFSVWRDGVAEWVSGYFQSWGVMGGADFSGFTRLCGRIGIRG